MFYRLKYCYVVYIYRVVFFLKLFFKFLYYVLFLWVDIEGRKFLFKRERICI